MEKYKDLNKDEIIWKLEKEIDAQQLIINEQAIKNSELLKRQELLEERIDHNHVWFDGITRAYKEDMKAHLENQAKRYENNIKGALSELKGKPEDINKSPLL